MLLVPTSLLHAQFTELFVAARCTFNGWKAGSERSRCALHDPNRPLMVWERVCSAFGFDHVARVEVVTSHVGCRHQVNLGIGYVTLGRGTARVPCPWSRIPTLLIAQSVTLK